jgi:hypothetical protein
MLGNWNWFGHGQTKFYNSNKVQQNQQFFYSEHELLKLFRNFRMCSSVSSLKNNVFSQSMHENLSVINASTQVISLQKV